MPIQPDRIEERIYISKWQGDVTAGDFQQAHHGGVAMAREHGEDDFYVLILDMANDVSLPLNPKAAQYALETVQYDIRSVIIGVNVPPAMTLILEGLDLASPQVDHTEIVNSLSEAITRARAIRTNFNTPSESR